MNKTYRTVVIIVIVAVVSGGAWYIYQSRHVRPSGILTENIARNGDTWNADFTARIAAEEPKVFDAIRNIEKSHSDSVRQVTVIDSNATSKTVDMTMDGPVGQTIETKLKFDYDEPNERISYVTLDNPILETQAQYQFKPEGFSTLITYHQTTKMLQQLPVPDAMVKRVIEGIFVAQLDGLKKSLNLPETEQADTDDDND